MNTHTNYLAGFIDALEASALKVHTAKQNEIAAAKAKLDASISAFGAVRKSYLSDLSKLREIYRPVFADLLEDIKQEKLELETLTGSAVIIDE